MINMKNLVKIVFKFLSSLMQLLPQLILPSILYEERDWDLNFLKGHWLLAFIS